jgi:hypothetical protein
MRASHLLQIGGGAMSDLVEKVMTAINTCEGHDDEYRRQTQYLYVEAASHAAIKAVADWIAEQPWQPTCRGDVTYFLRKQLEKSK